MVGAFPAIINMHMDSIIGESRTIVSVYNTRGNNMFPISICDILDCGRSSTAEKSDNSICRYCWLYPAVEWADSCSTCKYVK